MIDETIETNNLIKINNICIDAIKNLKMIAIIGDTGLGKTTGLLKFKQENFKLNIFYVKVRKSMNTRQFYVKMYQEISEEKEPLSGNINTIIDRIGMLLNKSGQKNILIIDECGRFTKNQFHYIQEVRDLTEQSTGIVLAGPNYFKTNLKKWKTIEAEGIPELYRRINAWGLLSPPTPKEINSFLKFHKITDPEIIEEALKVENFGELMNIINSYKILIENSQGKE